MVGLPYVGFLSDIPTSDFLSFFFFNDTATTEIYTLSLHDALPIYMYLVLQSSYFQRNGDVHIKHSHRHWIPAVKNS